MIRRNAEDFFVPEFDADGNQLYIQTETGNWALNYNAANRPTDFSCMDEGGNFITVKCDYDSMGRRTFKKVISSNGTVISHQRFIYRGYLQIACVDLTRTNHSALWLITWDPTQPIATRPLAIQKDGTWYTYGLDLTKNVCEVFGPAGNIRTAYTYSPYGSVTSTGNVTQPIQWSSEHNDKELGLIYYNYRHYNPVDGRWIRRDILDEKYIANIYTYCKEDSITKYDILGMLLPKFDREKNITIIDLREYNLKMPIYQGGRTMGITTMYWPEFETFAACYGNALGLILTYPPEIEIIYYSDHIDRLGNTVEEHEAYHANSNISYWNWFSTAFLYP